ncbi:MAG: hypothetical protein VW405_05935 [Rhodospirillaceae bacterium]
MAGTDSSVALPATGQGTKEPKVATITDSDSRRHQEFVRSSLSGANGKSTASVTNSDAEIIAEATAWRRIVIGNTSQSVSVFLAFGATASEVNKGEFLAPWSRCEFETKEAVRAIASDAAGATVSIQIWTVP